MVSSVKLGRYKRLISQLFPTGKVWDQKEESGSNLKNLIDSLAVEPCRIDERALALIEEVDPRTTDELLTDWERLMGLPDDCDEEPQNLTKQQRRDRIVQVLSMEGGQYPNFFVQLAANFGFTITADDISDNVPFLAGGARAGDRLTNGPWIYTFIIRLPFTEATKFLAGQGRAGDRLEDFSNPTLECLIDKHKPAHTIAIFTFEAI